MGIKDTVKKLLPDDVIVQLKSVLEKRNNKMMLAKAAALRPFAQSSAEGLSGINLIGDIKAETGLGQSMRLLAGILEQAGIPFCVIQVDSPGGLEHSDTKWEHKIRTEAIYNINLIHVNPNVWAEVYNALPEEVLAGKYQIAYWLWELEDFPQEWVPCIDTVDEIWAPSEFICASIRKCTNKPVVRVPYIVKLEEGEHYGREYFKLPTDKFLYLMMYDFKSISERKNPGGALEAYKKAFPAERQDVGLVIKVNHLKGNQELQRLQEELGAYKNVYFLTENMSWLEVESLIKSVDVLISLHRSEGFGLPMAEAMALGTPVVCTNWSATTEFMDETCACLVGYQLITLEKRVGPYKKGSRWADADVEQAARYIAELSEEKEHYRELAANGQKKVHEYLSFEKVKGQIAGRLEAITGKPMMG